jgi:nifR3 family TIM-barrel protein
MKNFWEKLSAEKKPFFCLAPMANVTDAAFRRVVAGYSKFNLLDDKQKVGLDVIFTEMVACDGLCSIGQEKLLPLLKFSGIERPVVAQLFGSRPENFTRSAQLIKELGFDGIDINMGCPQKNILKQGAGSDLINHPDLAKEIIRATKVGAGGLPVSVKTRIGFNKNELETWLPVLLEEQPAMITIHGRTKKEMSKVLAHWNVIKRATEIAKGSGVIIVGNGDVQSIEDGKEKAQASGVDGVMIGRAILGKPWLFDISKSSEVGFPNVGEVVAVLMKHLELFEKLYGPNNQGDRVKNFALMKKHMGAYLVGFKGAKELRKKLMVTNGEEEAIKIIQIFKEDL